MMFEATRQAGLRRLEAFLPSAGQAYQERRNFDVPASGVSGLSPWIRHRLLTEDEILRRILEHHTPREAQSFVQEVFWRGYFKGWLQQRPTVWHSYKAGRDQARAGAGGDYRTAIEGRTGIDCFDHWSRQLITEGYLHNHARMWFASIWIFTLRLPWQLGADFFLTHLRDGDPASNTLSWRWVAGLHTKGKHYLASAENIARFTEGRFNPVGQLATDAMPLTETAEHPFIPFAPPAISAPGPHLRLLTEEDCGAGLTPLPQEAGVLAIVSPLSSDFAQAAICRTATEQGGEICIGHLWSEAILRAAEAAGVAQVVVDFTPVGPVADGLDRARARLAQAGIRVQQVLRPYDRRVWPHADKGFFKLKKQIPKLLTSLGITDG